MKAVLRVASDLLSEKASGQEEGANRVFTCPLPLLVAGQEPTGPRGVTPPVPARSWNRAGRGGKETGSLGKLSKEVNPFTDHWAWIVLC